MRIPLIFLCCCALTIDMYGQHVIEWIKQHPHSEGKLVEFTSDNKIIVCGTFGNDYPSDWVDIVTICYDTSGNLIWQKFFSDTINGGIEEPFDMAIDSFNNIYIAGRMHLSFDGLPITANSLLLKYDIDGNLLWHKQYGDSLGFTGAARRMQWENGSIYISGNMAPVSGGTNHSFLAKYDTSGQLLWSKVDTNQFETIGRSVFTDKASNVYLVGTTACCTPGYKMFVSKYDSSGSNIWNTIIYDSAHIYAYTWESTIDDSANIYITGETQDTLFSTAYDCVVAKVDSSGLQKWFYTYTTDSSYYWEESNSIIVNSEDGIYVAGNVDVSSRNYGFLIKVSTGGNLVWDSIFSSFPLGNGFTNIFFDSTNIIVLGTGYFDGVIEEARVFCFDSSGLENWSIGLEGHISPNAGVYSSRSYYCTGFNSPGFGNPTDDSLFILKINYDLTNSLGDTKHIQFFNIYPNPARNFFDISFKNSITTFSLNVFNSLGQNVCSVENVKNNVHVNCSTWSRGLYVIHLEINSEYYFYKIIIN